MIDDNLIRGLTQSIFSLQSEEKNLALETIKGLNISQLQTLEEIFNRFFEFQFICGEVYETAQKRINQLKS